MSMLEQLPIHFPSALREVLRLQANEKTRGKILAGGTDLMAQWAAGVPLPERAISIFGLAELQAVEETADALTIGAGVTHSRVASHPLIMQHVPMLSQAAASVGALQIQNRGTLGGNVVNASPAGDLAPALLAADGVAIAQSVRGVREIPLTAFWTGYRKTDLQPDEILLAVRVLKKGRATESFQKLGTRQAQAISKIMAACRVEMEGGVIRRAAIAFGSAAATAVRLDGLEKFLCGKKLTPKLLHEAEELTTESIHPITDIRSTADYRKWVSGRLIRRFLEGLSVR